MARHTIDDYSASVIQKDHAALANLTHPQGKPLTLQTTTGQPSPTIPELGFMILCLPANYDGSAKTWDWQRAYYDADNKKIISDTSDVNAYTMGRGIPLAPSGACLVVRACDTDGNPVNVMVGIPNGSEAWQCWTMKKDPVTNQLSQGWDYLRMHDNML